MPTKPLVYPVIHYKDDPTTLNEAAIALETPGVDGLFLISHHGNPAIDFHLVPLALKIKRIYPHKSVGLNMLTARDPLDDVLDRVRETDIDMIWFDNLHASSRGISPTARAISEAITYLPLKVFSGVAFKYQQEEPDPERAATINRALGFIPTTSGDETGKPPTVEKLTLMSRNGTEPLAVASGMAPDNVASFAPYLSHILVSTHISKDVHHIDPAKLRAFMAALGA